MLGDLTGPSGWPEGKVDMRDIGIVAKCFGSQQVSNRYNPNADINADGTTDMTDIAIGRAHV